MRTSPEGCPGPLLKSIAIFWVTAAATAWLLPALPLNAEAQIANRPLLSFAFTSICFAACFGYLGPAIYFVLRVLHVQGPSAYDQWVLVLAVVSWALLNALSFWFIRRAPKDFLISTR